MLEVFAESFFINGLFAVLVSSVITAPLGSFMLWNRLSYMGDSVAHSSLLGVGIAIMFQVNLSLSILIVALFLAVVASLTIGKLYSPDTILNIITSVAVSVGMILLSFVPFAGGQVMHSLFGDVLMIRGSDLLQMVAAGTIGICLVAYRWRLWIAVSMSSDLSLSMGINTRMVKLEFLVILALYVVFFSQFIGILLITAFLIIPASGARLFAKTPVQMVVTSGVLSAISGVVGLFLSVKLDTFPGPLIIVVAFLLLLLCLLKRVIG